MLLDSYRAIARAIQEERGITPAAEWLVDNFHIVEEQLREIQDDLPSGDYRDCRNSQSVTCKGIREFTEWHGPM